MPEPQHPRRSRGELLRDFLRPSRGQFVAAVVLFATALLLTWTWRSQQGQPEFAQARQADLVQLLDTVTSQNRTLEAELRELQSNRDALSSGADQAKTVREDAQRRLEQLRILAGTAPAKGPGVRITITDPEGNLTAELLLNAVEELRDAGAEVIEFDDEVRLVTNSAFTQTDDGTVVLDGVELPSPLFIEAIGDPSTLEAGARFRGGLVSEIEGTRVGGRVLIEQLDEVSIDTVVQPASNEYARPR